MALQTSHQTVVGTHSRFAPGLCLQLDFSPTPPLPEQHELRLNVRMWFGHVVATPSLERRSFVLSPHSESLRRSPHYPPHIDTMAFRAAYGLTACPRHLLPLLQHSHTLLAPKLKFAQQKTATSQTGRFPLLPPSLVAKGKGSNWLSHPGKQMLDTLWGK